MQFTTSLALVGAAALALVQGVAAVDNRQLYTFSGGDGVAFCKSWKCNCINYEPTNTNLYFQTAYCVPGNFSGKNRDSEARAFCSFTDGNTTTTVNKHVAAASNATLASGN